MRLHLHRRRSLVHWRRRRRVGGLPSGGVGEGELFAEEFDFVAEFALFVLGEGEVGVPIGEDCRIVFDFVLGFLQWKREDICKNKDKN